MSAAYTRGEMLEFLHNGVCEVKFIKKNGEERNMSCTLKEDLIPKEIMPKSDSENWNGVDQTIGAIRVVDTNKNEWRSFLVDNVLKFSHPG